MYSISIPFPPATKVLVDIESTSICPKCPFKKKRQEPPDQTHLTNHHQPSKPSAHRTDLAEPGFQRICGPSQAEPEAPAAGGPSVGVDAK